MFATGETLQAQACDTKTQEPTSAWCSIRRLRRTDSFISITQHERLRAAL